jgi:hypothetical protein
VPYDVLPALTRLEGRLRTILARQARKPPRRLLLLALVPLLSLAMYAGAVRWLLSGPRLRALINTNPESLTLDYDEASSFWPGRVTIRNLRIRGSDQNVQWIIRLAEARIDYSVLALASRTFRAERVRGSGLSFFLRRKREAAEATSSEVSVLPPIPGFPDPPLRAPEAQGPRMPGDPWRIEVRNIRIDDFDDVWFDACRYRGAAHLDGAFFLRPGMLVWVGPARVTVDSGEMRIGRAPAGIALAGRIEATFEPFEPPRVHGSEVWRSASGSATLDARFDRLASLEHLVPAGSVTRLEEGAGSAKIRIALENGTAKGEIGLAVHDGSVRMEKLALRGDADVRLLIPEWNLTTGPLDVSGSRVAFSDVRAAGSDDSRRWWGRFAIPTGRIGALTTAVIDAETRDARPLLALLGAELPSWTRGLVNLDGFSGTGTVSLGPSFARVRRLDARGGTFHIQGRYLRDHDARDGAFLIESGILSVGLELQPDATTLRLLGARKWFGERRDEKAAARAVTPRGASTVAARAADRGAADPGERKRDRVSSPIPSDGPIPQDRSSARRRSRRRKWVSMTNTDFEQSKCAACGASVEADGFRGGDRCEACAGRAARPSTRPRSGTILRHWTTNVGALRGNATATRSDASDWGLADARRRNLLASKLKSLAGAAVSP